MNPHELSSIVRRRRDAPLNQRHKRAITAYDIYDGNSVKLDELSLMRQAEILVGTVQRGNKQGTLSAFFAIVFLALRTICGFD
jgi:hypothetical protein